jgi:hypothetical protein
MGALEIAVTLDRVRSAKLAKLLSLREPALSMKNCMCAARTALKDRDVPGSLFQTYLVRLSWGERRIDDSDDALVLDGAAE